MRRAARWAVGCGLALALITPAAAQAAAFPVNPGPMAAGRIIIGTGQNLPPIADATYNVGPYMAPQVEAYYTGTAIQQDRADVTLAAWRFVRDWVRERCGTTPAEVRACKAMVVFDVDETLLNSYSYSIAQDPQFTFNPTTWTAYVDACDYAGIPQARDLFNRLKKLGVRIALVSSGNRDTKAARGASDAGGKPAAGSAPASDAAGELRSTPAAPPAAASTTPAPASSHKAASRRHTVTA